MPVPVDSNCGNSSLTFSVHYMSKSAFEDFPGRNGIPHRAKFKIKE